MLRKLFLPSFLACAFLMLGCSKTEMNNNNSAAANTNKAATTTNTSTTGTTSSTATSSSDKIGIAECDDFIAKYEACTPKVPEAGRAAYKDAMDQWRKQWKQLAANPTTKGTLASICKQAAEQQKASLKAYGCEQ